MLALVDLYVLVTLALGTVASANLVLTKRQGSAGCGISHNVGYNTNGSSEFSLGSRTYTVLVPVNYNSSRPYSLIIDFHGRNGSPNGQHANSQYEKFDTNGDFVVAYPRGVNAAWEGATYADPTVDDKAFTVDLVQHMKDKYCIDSARVYASGKSNGGGFVGTLACSAQGSLFAAFAMNSAAFYTDNLGAGTTNRLCTPSRATIPIIEVHGSADGTISYDGGKGAGGAVPPIPQWLDTWATRNAAVDKKVQFPSPTYGERVNLTTWHVSGTNQIVLEGVWIKDMDHCWAAVESNTDWGIHGDAECKAPLNASQLFMTFFNNWDLNGFRG